MAANTKSLRIGVVGAGVIGLTTAVHLLERFPGGIDLTIMADKFSPHIVSDMAAGIFLYTDLGVKTDKVLAESRKWLSISLERFQMIFRSPENTKVGVSLSNGYFFSSSSQPDPWWKDMVYGFRQVELDSTEAKALQVPPDTVTVWAFSTYTWSPPLYMEWLMHKAKEGGCKVIKTKITSLDELSLRYDIVINCTGLSSSKELVFDKALYPIQGQAVIIKAPWVNHWIVHMRSDGISYIIPRTFDVMLGGTAEVGNWKDTTDAHVINDIVRHCQKLVPSLAGSQTVRSFAGLRPGRDTIRLDCCDCSNGNLLIHCYGHGGKGFVLSWGCAMDVGDMVEQRLSSRRSSLTRANL